jgi:hypothetical protein
MMGVFCAAGTLSFYVAVKHTSASNVSQYHYTQLLTGALISYLVWHDKPGLPMLAGGSLIIGSGLLIALAARNAQPALLPDIAMKPAQPACRPLLRLSGSGITLSKLESRAAPNSTSWAPPGKAFGSKRKANANANGRRRERRLPGPMLM